VKAFTERNPVVIGVAVVAFIAVATGSALALDAGLFASRYTVLARFEDTAGLQPGDKVRVAGVPSGEVGSIGQQDGMVEVALKIDDGIELSRDTRAAVVVETLLGQKYVRLTTGDDWSGLLEDGDVITDTRTPTEVLDLQNVGTPLLEESDGQALNDLMESLSEVTEGKREQVRQIIDGLERLTTAVNDRKAEASSLIDSASVLSDTLAERDADLLNAIDNLNVVVGSLAERRAELVRLLEATASAAGATADLVGENRERLDSILDELHADLQIVGRHQVDLAESIAYLGVAVEGFSSIGYSGPEEFPNEWANIFTQLLGPTGPDALFGSCGLVDDALDIALGPDPLPCSERTGPLPGEDTGPGPADPSGNPPAGASSQPGAGGTATAPAAAPERTELQQSLDLLMAPLLGGTRS
jgi:phospholipid/cholesterol/gamma-HCH transport system substrate-binding protein